MGLSNRLQDESVKASIAKDVAQLIEEQVAVKGGISGLALKATYGVVKGASANYIPGAIQRLLPEAMLALDPIWDEGVQAGDPVAHLTQNSDHTADTILSVTDAKIKRVNNGLVCSAYNKLRNSVKSDIEAAIPGFAQILGKHINP
jgi:hypothetical protein